jgi:hypothetical protein
VRSIQELIGNPSPVRSGYGPGERAEEEDADDCTKGQIPDQMEVSTAHDHLEAAEDCPGDDTEDASYKGKVDHFPFDRSRFLAHAVL